MPRPLQLLQHEAAANQLLLGDAMIASVLIDAIQKKNKRALDELRSPVFSRWATDTRCKGLQCSLATPARSGVQARSAHEEIDARNAE